MPNYIFTNLLGCFVFDGNNRIIDKVLFKELSHYKSKDKTEQSLRKKHQAIKPPEDLLHNFLPLFKDSRYFAQFRELNLSLAKEKIRLSVNQDNLICQAINSIIESDKVINTLVKRLREWYSLYNPEFSESISNNEKFAELITLKSRNELMKELHISSTMGSDLSKKDLSQILSLAKQVTALSRYKESTLLYVEQLMIEYCPNIMEVAGATIAARLIEHTGSLKRLAFLPASTIQILGAEKALFRHMKTGAKPPKFGLLHEHQFIQSAKKPEQGKRARALADKLSIAARVDYFKGKPIGKKLVRELKEKFK